MAGQLANILVPGTSASRSEKDSRRTVESYEDGDPRLRMSSAQWRALGPLIRGESIPAIATRCGTSPDRVRRWLKSPIFRRAVAAEIAMPTDGQFGLSIALRGVQEANTLRRELAAARELEAGDERG